MWDLIYNIGHFLLILPQNLLCDHKIKVICQMVHSIVLYPQGGAQHRSYKPTHRNIDSSDSMASTTDAGGNQLSIVLLAGWPHPKKRLIKEV